MDNIAKVRLADAEEKRRIILRVLDKAHNDLRSAQATIASAEENLAAIEQQLATMRKSQKWVISSI
jgi:hypothetical protein